MDSFLDQIIEVSDFRVDLLEIPFNSPVHLPFGLINSRPSVWLTVKASVNGVLTKGAAEGTALPMQIPMYDDYSGNLKENIEKILHSLKDRSLIMRETPDIIDSIDIGGNFATARMTVESSIMDAAARSTNKSIVSYLDNNPSDAIRRIPYGKSIAEQDKNNMMIAAENAIKRGAKRIKFKLSPSNYENLYLVLSDLVVKYPNIDFMVDANGMFDPGNKEHIAILQSIDSLNLLTIEEPVSRVGTTSGLDAYRMLASAINFSTPITIDDAIKTLSDAYKALDEGIADIVNLKPGRMGSFIKCLNIADYAKSHNKEVMVGGMFEATPGRMMTLSLATYCMRLGFEVPGDVSLPQERLGSDIVERSLYLDEDYNVVFKPKLGWGYAI